VRSKSFWTITHEVIGELFRVMSTDCRAAAKELTGHKTRARNQGAHAVACSNHFGTFLST
jgi:hypothetical protein